MPSYRQVVAKLSSSLFKNSVDLLHLLADLLPGCSMPDGDHFEMSRIRKTPKVNYNVD